MLTTYKTTTDVIKGECNITDGVVNDHTMAIADYGGSAEVRHSKQIYWLTGREPVSWYSY